MDQPFQNFTQHDRACCWSTRSYYDEFKYLCALTALNAKTVIEFPPAQQGLIITGYGFTVAKQVSISGTLYWFEQTYDLLGYYAATLKINNSAIEGYSGKQFPISGYIQGNVGSAVPPVSTLTVLNPAWLCDVDIRIDRQNSPVSVEFQNLKVIPDNTCFFARIRGKYYSA